MVKNFRDFQYYKYLLKKNYIYPYVKGNEIKYRVNHLRCIIELLIENPEKIYKKEFINEAEEYERKNFRDGINTRRLRAMRKTIKLLRKNPELVEELIKELKQYLYRVEIVY